MRKPILILLLCAALLCAALAVLYQWQPLHDRLAWRVASLQAKAKRMLNPPEELLFIPAETIALLETPQTPPPDPALLSPNPMEPTVASPTLAEPTFTPLPSPTPPASPTPLPSKVRLSGITHQYQQFNNCGPANLAMALSFWGWQGDQNDTRLFLRPNRDVDDKNVNPAEMVAFVERFAGLSAVYRFSGDLDTLRSLIAAGFPVLIEAGHHPPNDWWMGHYLVVSGYDDELRMLTVQDSLSNPDTPLGYDELVSSWWRDFNYVYLVIFPAERQAQVANLLGLRMDEAYSYQLAAQRALEEITSLQERDLFFAWFNLGSSRVGLGDYAGAAQAYDKAFEIYQSLSEPQRPYRLMWYQSAPYQAYFYTGRYQDVISLANTTFSWAGQPVLEESYYWRGMAYEALGELSRAIADFTKAAALNPNYEPPRLELTRLGAPLP